MAEGDNAVYTFIETIHDGLAVEEEKPIGKMRGDTTGAIIKPGQIRYVNGIPYYHILTEYTDTGSGVKTKAKVGYVKKSYFDSLNINTVQIPANFAGLEAEMVPPRLMDQLFRIVEVVENEDYVEVTARHVWYDNLKNYTLWEVPKQTQTEDYTAAAVCRNILNNALSPTSSRVATDCTDTKKGSEFDYKNKNIVEAFLDPENGVCAKFGLSLIRYNWDFYCLKEVGYDRGFIVENGKNLLGVERTESIENLATRVCPFGKDKSGNIIWLNNNGVKWVDSQYIGDYSCPHVELLDTGLQIGKDDTSAQNIQQKLLEAGQKRFSEDHVDLPEVEMTIEFLSLGDTEEYAQYRGLDKVYLYDIITIHDTVRGYDYTAQVVGVEHDILTGMLTSVTIGKLNNWDGTRKIATWQVPEVRGENIRLQSIQAGAFAPGAIGANDLQEAIISYVHIASATIDSLTADSVDAVTAHIHEIIAGSITADDIQAESIRAAIIAAGKISADDINALSVRAAILDAEKIKANDIDANSVRAAIIAAGKITANDIAANTITAENIATNQVSAINALLSTATISNGLIDNADIGFAHIMDASVDSLITRDAVSDRYFIDKLWVNNAQMVYATVGELVVKASDDKYYRLDIDSNGQLTPTEVTLTIGEITAGVTSDGKASIIETDLSVTDLSASNMKGISALIDKITASRIDVDELWARQAFIGKLMVTDISANPTIGTITTQIGDWTSGSTITQTINSLNSRISELGYGTVYMQPTEPDHDHLVSGDIWIQTMTDGSWQEIYDDFATWQDIYDNVGSWQVLGSIPIMWVWDGQRFQLMYDALLPTTVMTEIEQLSTAITLKANQSAVDILSGEVSDFSAQLTIQAQEIEAAVSAVNAKAASYVMWADPRTVYTITIGDMWIKRDPDFCDTSTWQDVLDNFTTWNALKTMHDAWADMLGDRTFVWNGSEWVETSDRATDIFQRTLIDQTSTQVSILAETTASLGGDIYELSANLTVANERISAEVQRATTAENGKLAKTSQYQTADSIVTEAVSQAATNTQNGYIAKTSTLQTATAIVTEAVSQSATAAGQTYIAKTSTYQTADSIVTEAVRQSGVNAGSAYIAKTSSYQTATSIVNEAVRQAGVNTSNGYIAKTSSYQTADSIVTEAVRQSATSAGQNYIAKTSTYQTADSIVSSAQSYTNNKLTDYSTTTQTNTMISQYVTNNAYKLVSGITITANGVDISGSQYVKIASGGYFRVTSGNFGIKSDAGDNEYAIWSGASTAASSPFRVKKNGEVYLTKLIAVGEDSSETEVNLRTAGLWKLNYKTVKSASVVGGYCSAMTFSDGTTVNFNRAASVTLSGSWGGSSDPSYTVTATNGQTNNSGQVQVTRINPGGVPAKNVRVRVTGGSSILFDKNIDATSVYNDGWHDAEGSASLEDDTVTAVFASSTVGTLTTKTFRAYATANWAASESMIYRGQEWFRGITASARIGWSEE